MTVSMVDNTRPTSESGLNFAMVCPSMDTSSITHPLILSRRRLPYLAELVENHLHLLCLTPILCCRSCQIGMSSQQINLIPLEATSMNRSAERRWRTWYVIICLGYIRLHCCSSEGSLVVLTQSVAIHLHLAIQRIHNRATTLAMSSCLKHSCRRNRDGVSKGIVMQDAWYVLGDTFFCKVFILSFHPGGVCWTRYKQ